MQAVYFRDADGNEPVNDFIDDLDPERQREILYTGLALELRACPRSVTCWRAVPLD